MKVADATPDKADILAVVRPLCRFAGRLNDYARRTQRVSPTAQKVREYLQTATRPDKLVFEDLPHACGLGPIAPRGHLSEDVLSQYITTLRGALGELHRCYDELLADLTKSIGKAFQIEGDRSEIRQRIADRTRRSGTGSPIRASRALFSGLPIRISMISVGWNPSWLSLAKNLPAIGATRTTRVFKSRS